MNGDRHQPKQQQQQFIHLFIYLFIHHLMSTLSDPEPVLAAPRNILCGASLSFGGCYPPLLCNDIHELGPPYGRVSVVCVSCYRSSQRLLGAIWLRPNDRGRANPPEEPGRHRTRCFVEGPL